MARIIRTAVLFVLALTLSIVGLGTASHALTVERGTRALHVAEVTASTCTADVRLWEDGSWSGIGLTVDGVRIADAWEVTHPEFRGMQSSGVYGVDWPVALTDGTLCTVQDLGTSQLRTSCVASVQLWEDGSWSGMDLTVDRERVASLWTVSGPELQGTVTSDGVAHLDFPATWHGAQCSIGVL